MKGKGPYSCTRIRNIFSSFCPEDNQGRSQDQGQLRGPGVVQGLDREGAIFLHLGEEHLLHLIAWGSEESSGEGVSPLSFVHLLVAEGWGRKEEDFWGAGWLRSPQAGV